MTRDRSQMSGIGNSNQVIPPKNVIAKTTPSQSGTENWIGGQYWNSKTSKESLEHYKLFRNQPTGSELGEKAWYIINTKIIQIRHMWGILMNKRGSNVAMRKKGLTWSDVQNTWCIFSYAHSKYTLYYNSGIHVIKYQVCTGPNSYKQYQNQHTKTTDHKYE